MFDLKEKTALVTGASGGIGGATARQLHQNGATVALSGTRQEALQVLADELGDRCCVIPANLADRQDVDSLISSAEENLGQIDILVNNAGVTNDNVFMRMKDEEWDRVLEINLTSCFRLMRGVIRGMMKRRHGRIINISSVVGTSGNPGQANYASAKAGMIGMTKSLALEVASRGITVNAVAPGFIATAMTDMLNDAQRETILARVPAGKLGESDDIAAAILFLASSEASYVTGQTIHVNGGMLMI